MTHRRLIYFKLRNLTGLILCFLLGFAYFYYGLCSIQETDIFIPVDSGKIPEGLIITNGPFKGIEVHVRGPKSISTNPF